MDAVGRARSVGAVLLILALVLASQVVSLAAASGAHALSTTYYVDGTNGSDGNPGTFDQPWRTVQKAADTMISGDTVYIRAGTYNQRVTLEHRGNSSGLYITFAAYPGEQVILDGTGIDIPHGGGLFHVWATDYVRVSGLRVQNSMAAGIYAAYSDHIIVDSNRTYNTVSSGIGIWGSNAVIVDGNDIELACNPGMEENLTIADSYDVDVRNNHVHDGPKGLDPARAGGEGINVKDGSHDVRVYDNVVHDLEKKLGFGLDGWNTETYDVEFYRNVAYDCGMGFLIESEGTGLARDIYIYNNVAYNNTHFGFYIPSYVLDGPKANFYFINNTAYGNDVGLRVNSTNVTNIVFRNNVSSQNTTAQIQILAGAQEDCVIDHNLYYGAGSPMGSDYVIGDPLFVNAAEGDFHLQGGSPAIDAGSPTGAPDTDFDGNPRPRGTGYDIGAPEYTWEVLIIDDTDPRFSTQSGQDAWQEFVEMGGQHYGGQHHYNSEVGTGSDIATWSFSLPQPGEYRVYAWWYEGGQKPTDVPYTVNHLGGSATIRVNQQINGGQWNLLGTFAFQEQGSVVLSDDASSGQEIVADAIRLVYVWPYSTYLPSVTRNHRSP